MSELSFLIDLLLEHKLHKTTKDAIKDRIKEIQNPGPVTYAQMPAIRPAKASQSPSTQRILDEMAAEGACISTNLNQNIVATDPNPSGPVQIVQIAQTPAAAAALAARSEAIRIATSGKEERGRTSPRKF